MGSNFGLPYASRQKLVDIRPLGYLVIFKCCKDPNRGILPFDIQTVGHGALAALITAVIADQHNRLEAMEFEAACRGLQHLFKRSCTDRDRARKFHMAAWRFNAAFRNI